MSRITTPRCPCCGDTRYIAGTVYAFLCRCSPEICYRCGKCHIHCSCKDGPASFEAVITEQRLKSQQEKHNVSTH